MSEEEKKTIKYINKILEYPKLYAHTRIESDFLVGIDKEKIEMILNLIQKQQAELEKKDKIIDLMVKAMDKIQDPQVCKYCDSNINLNHGYCADSGKCKKGIKQYFKKKVEEK